MAAPAGTKTPTMQDLLKYWYEDISIEDIAKKLGVTVGKIYALRRRYKLPKRSPLDKKGVVEYEPTPEEIREITAGIRAEWTETQEISRRVGWKHTEAWTPPTFSYNTRTGLFSAEERKR